MSKSESEKTPAAKPKRRKKTLIEAAQVDAGFSELMPDAEGAGAKKKSKVAQALAERPPTHRALADESILDAIAQHVGSLQVAPQSKIKGMELLETWLNEVASFDLQFPTVAVEVPFFIILEKYTIVVGVQDKLSWDAAGLFGCEWKTTKGTTRFWNEDKWLAEITNNPQISVYGLAQHEGFFDVSEQEDFESPCGEVIQSTISGARLWQPCVKKPRVMVRAITKEQPPAIWPTDAQHAFFEIDATRLKTVREALARKADIIRAARNRGTIPWEIPGLQCMGHFFKRCSFEGECLNGIYPESAGDRLISASDPGSAGVVAAQELLRVPLNDPRVVVLSSSSYSDTVECLERHRRVAIVGQKDTDDEQDVNLQTGTVLHAGAAIFYKEARKRK